MTDTMHDFGAPEVEESSGPDRRLLIGGGAAVAVLLAVAGYFLLSGGSDTGNETFVVKKHPPFAAAPSASPSLAVVPPPSNVPLGRDPFKPLYVVPVATAAPAGSTPGGATGGSTTGGTGGSSSGSTAGSPPSGDYALTLTAVTGTADARTAQFNAAKQKLTAQVGTDFGLRSELKLLALQQGPDGTWVARVQVGDDSPFDVYQGQAVSVP